MNSKNYLKQVFFLNQRIDDSLQELEQLRVRAFSIGAIDTSKDKVQSGKISDIVGDNASAIIDLEAKINRKINEYAQRKNEVECMIDRMVDDALKLILQKRYLLFKEWEQIAVDIGYTYRHTIRLHGEALRAFNKIYVLECPIESVV